MTPKEKAVFLVNGLIKVIATSYHYDSVIAQLNITNIHTREKMVKSMVIQQAKYCATKAVDDILLEGTTHYGAYAVEFGREDYWLEVKQEIEKL